EFRKDATSGRWILIEINGRFWGSLPLAIAAGADFPAWLYDLLVEGRRRFPREYEVGLLSRNASLDLECLGERIAIGDRSNAARALGREPAAMARGKERNDTLVLDDPIPGLLEIEEIGRYLASSVFRRSKLALLDASPLRAAAIARARPRIVRAERVLFVCKGNICRSPFAEAYAKCT